MTYVAIVTQEGDHWLATVRGLPVHTFASTPSELLANVAEALEVFLDVEAAPDFKIHGGSVDDGFPECSAVRPGTLGYQQCFRVRSHVKAHKSQDGKTW